MTPASPSVPKKRRRVSSPSPSSSSSSSGDSGDSSEALVVDAAAVSTIVDLLSPLNIHLVKVDFSFLDKNGKEVSAYGGSCKICEGDHSVIDCTHVPRLRRMHREAMTALGNDIDAIHRFVEALFADYAHPDEVRAAAMQLVLPPGDPPEEPSCSFCGTSNTNNNRRDHLYFGGCAPLTIFGLCIRIGLGLSLPRPRSSRKRVQITARQLERWSSDVADLEEVKGVVAPEE
jgi:hypothetical protein